MGLFTPRRTLLGPQRGTYRREVDAAADRHRWAGVWRDAADGAGLSRVVKVAAGETIIVPALVSVGAGFSPVLIVRLLPGQLAADVRAVADRLAPALGAVRVRVQGLTDGVHVRLELLDADPLAEPFTLGHRERDGFLGVDELGDDIAVPWQHRVHTLVQGSSGFGKSTLLYAQLSALAPRPDVVVTGLDPSGLVFRPWDGLPGGRWRVSGLGGGLADHTRVLGELCDEMDRRLELLPAGVDNLITSPELPAVVVVLEELSGFLRTLDVDRKLAATVRALLGRLFAEGRKVGLRMLAVIPRADATVLGAGIRDQCQLKISFAVEPEGYRMAHPASAPISADEHAASAPGLAVVTAPVLGTFRMRAGDLPYAEYCHRVATAATACTTPPVVELVRESA